MKKYDVRNAVTRALLGEKWFNCSVQYLTPSGRTGYFVDTFVAVDQEEATAMATGACKAARSVRKLVSTSTTLIRELP